MLVKVLPIKGTTMHVWDRKKYYPGDTKQVDDELGSLLVSRLICEEVPGKQETPEPVKRGPGRPRKSWNDNA